MHTDKSPNRSDDSYGDVAAAMELVVKLRGARSPVSRGFWDVFTRVDSRALLQGLNTLIPALMHLCDDPMDLVMPLVRTLREQDVVSDDSLPTAAAILTAAAMGQSPNWWRARLGRVDAAEMEVWAHTAAQLADLVDRAEGAGVAARMVNRTFGGLAQEAT